MKIDLTQPEQQFLVNMLLEEMKSINKTKQAFNVFSEDDPKSKHFKASFWELDNFVHSIYKKICEAMKCDSE
jgi:hypothetical protein